VAVKICRCSHMLAQVATRTFARARACLHTAFATSFALIACLFPLPRFSGACSDIRALPHMLRTPNGPRRCVCVCPGSFSFCAAFASLTFKALAVVILKELLLSVSHNTHPSLVELTPTVYVSSRNESPAVPQQRKKNPPISPHQPSS
jgi:hypothetical protein